MEVSYYIVMFAAGLVLLVWGSGLFVDSAAALANRLHLPEVLIGATIVSVGTTLPETLFSTMASVEGLPDMALGNALGSILCNTGFIAGILIFLRPVLLNDKEVKNVRMGLLFLGSAFLIYLVSGMAFGGLTGETGFLLLGLCAVYFVCTVRQATGRKKAAVRCAAKEHNSMQHTSAQHTSVQHTFAQRISIQHKSAQYTSAQKFGVSDIIRLILEAVVLYIGASFLVEYGPKLARAFHVPEVIISVTFVALGTSLPELVTSLAALKKRHSSLSLGNIIGADILNFLLVGGLSAAICPITYVGSVMALELPFIFVVLTLMCVPSIVKKRAGRLQGLLLIAVYTVYLTFIFR